jgi:integral membrane protein (TIGR01906 family)
MDFMKIVHILAGIFCVISLLVVILISSVDIAVYGDMRYFQKEYRKYDVIKNVNMEEKELLFVTEEMMSYLKGKRDNLNIEAVIDGEQQEFFNEKEIAHMKDVRVLFWGGQWLRRIGVIICIITVIFLLFQSKIEFLLKCLRNGLISFIVFMAILVGIITTNFTKYFVIFHKIFFSNNLWILNPETDRLINIVPEPFFIDTSIRIVVIFFSIILFVCIGCSVLLKIGIKKIGV